MGDALHAALQREQRALVREMLKSFGHAERRAALPVGTVEEAMA